MISEKPFLLITHLILAADLTTDGVTSWGKMLLHVTGTGETEKATDVNPWLCGVVSVERSAVAARVLLRRRYGGLNGF